MKSAFFILALIMSVCIISAVTQVTGFEAPPDIACGFGPTSPSCNRYCSRFRGASGQCNKLRCRCLLPIIL